MRTRKLPGSHLSACTGCRYCRPISSAPNADLICYYLLDTGEQRGCSPENCTRKQIITREEKPFWQVIWEKYAC